jgi:uncharacterized membrane-anchored protein
LAIAREAAFLRSEFADVGHPDDDVQVPPVEQETTGTMSFEPEHATRLPADEESTPAHGLTLVARPFSKVPEITAIFWVIKILTTAMGEATSDCLDHRLGPAITVALELTGFAVALALQFRANRYIPWIYWFSVSMVAVFGTMAADSIHAAGVPFYASTAFYAIVLALVFLAWYRREGTLSVHSIYTLHRERFYWATVLATFALGTATGDMTASTLHLGFATSGLIFAAIIVLPGIGYWRFGLNPIFAFWFAYVITRPLGASFADWFASSNRGLGFSTGPVSVVLALVILALVAFLAITHEDVEEEHHQHVGASPLAR